jgi:hypothetical protein
MAKAALMYYNNATFERTVENVGEDVDVCYLQNACPSNENIYLAPADFDPVNNHISGIAITCAVKEIKYIFTAKSGECIKINMVIAKNEKVKQPKQKTNFSFFSLATS